MKTNYLKTGLIVMFTIVFTASYAAIFHSTSIGGDWHEDATWLESGVPGATDDVVITGLGTVIIFSNYVHECNNLSVESNATLVNTSAHRTLNVHGNVINNGTITNFSTSWDFTLEIEGDVENYEDWDPYYTKLTGYGDHDLTCGSSKSFAGLVFNAADTTGNITALTEITFEDCKINLQNRTLILSATKGSGFNLVRDSETTYLVDAIITGNNNTIYLENGAFLNNVELTDGSLEGKVRVQGDCNFYGDIIVEDTLSVPIYQITNLDIYGTITNNGIITQYNHSWDLDMYCFGDVINNGTWETDDLFFAGSTAQNITCLNDHYFSCTTVKDTSSTSISPLVASSKLSFVGSTIDLNWGELDCNSNEIYLSGGAKMNEAILNNPIIAGEFFAGNDVEMTGDIEILDTLISLATTTEWFLNGDVVNSGLIKGTSTNYALDVYISGDIENNGEWITHETNLTGTEKQFLTLEAGKTFNCGELNDMDITAPIEAVTNLSFVNTILDMNGSEMIFPVTKGLTLSLSGGYIMDGIYTMNNGTIFMENDAQVRSTVTISDFSITGKMILYGVNLLFEGEVINQDTLESRINYSLIIDIEGNFTNNGLFQTPTTNYNMTANISGNITNNGEWKRIITHLSGTGTHEISQAPDSEFFGKNFYADAGTGITTALTDLNFRDCIVNFNDGELVFPVTKGLTLSLSGGYIIDGIYTMNNGTIFMENDAQVRSTVTISDFSITGNMILYGVNLLFEGEVINQDTLQSRINFTHNFDIDGNFTNNGLFQSPSTSYHMTANISGNITNNGEWKRIITHLSGLGTHEVFQAPGSEFFGRNFYADAGTGITTFLTDMNFRDCTVDFNDEVLVLNGNLSVSQEYLSQANISGNNHQLYMDDNARLAGSTLSDIVIAGKVRLTNAVSTFEGETIIQDTLENYTHNTSTFIVNGNITNNGVIRDYHDSYHLVLSSHGNIVNNGEWLNYRIEMNGSSDQHISCTNDNVFALEYFTDNDISSKIIVDDEIHFLKPYIDLNGAELVLPEGGEISVKSIDGNNCYLSDGSITGGNFTYTGNPYVYIYNMTIEPSVTLVGTVKVGTGVSFNDDISVMDTLSNQTNQAATLNVGGRIVNNGIIQDYSTSYKLTINVAEHIINNGEWINYRTYLNGTSDQLIYLIAGKEITGQFRFEAMFTNVSYQWKWNGTDLNSGDFTGETSDELIWNVPVSNDYNGYFGCQGAVDSSRHILIRSGIIIDPVVQLQGPYNGVEMDTDLAAKDLIPLTQPFNIAPWNYNGDEEVTSIPADIVDWILVELRQTTGGAETATSDSIVMQRALMLRNDGRVVDPWNHTPEMKYDIDLSDNVYMVIWHRNHLGVMSAVPISDGDSPAYFDFSESSTQAYGGTDALMDMGDGVFGLMGGDADYNQEITTQDKIGFWEPNVGLPCGYEAYDFTLDGQIDNQDKNQTWVKTLGKETQVPD